jgi:hypothetical protein
MTLPQRRLKHLLFEFQGIDPVLHTSLGLSARDQRLKSLIEDGAAKLQLRPLQLRSRKLALAPGLQKSGYGYHAKCSG